MLVDRVYTPGLAQVAYVVADEAAGVAAVIDPRRDVQVYLDWAERHRVRIIAVLETHIHADFVSGAAELARAAGATLSASRRGEQTFVDQLLDDGDEIAIGDLRLRAFWTPGHTTEHLSYLLFASPEAAAPVAMFSGDALFVDDVGRPDLLGAAEIGDLGHHLFETITRRLAALDDAVVVYPGHTAGSACGKQIGDAPNTTIGKERRDSYAFQFPDEADFIEAVMTGMPPPPTYYPMLKRINKAGVPPLAAIPAGEPLTVDDVAGMQQDGALVIDARGVAAFGAGHVPDALFTGLGPNFANWLGWVAPFDRDLVLVLDEPNQYQEARTAMLQIGLDRLRGYLAGGFPAWQGSGREVVTLPQISVEDLAARRLEPAADLAVLDVRSDAEWDAGHIEGAVHVFAGLIAQGEPVPFAPEDRVAVICGSGYRSSVAASLLQQRGYRHLINVAGGMGAWNEAGLPVVRDQERRVASALA